jgi:hypothetical protein
MTTDTIQAAEKLVSGLETLKRWLRAVIESEIIAEISNETRPK